MAGRARLWDSLRRMRSRFLHGLPIAMAVVSAAGCAVGDGSGSAMGTLWVSGCNDGNDYGSQAAPADFNLAPTYFAGEPIEDIGDSKPAHNRLIIRMQTTGNALEITDTVYFDIPFSYEVAQCVRGRTVNGVPDGDTTSTGTDYPIDPAGTPWCNPMGPNGIPRINLVPYGPVRAALTPFGTCHSQAHPPTVISVTGMGYPGWIEFLDFGSATQPTLAPDARTAVDQDFKVGYSERLRANFDFTLLDDRIANAVHLGLDPAPDPIITGHLMGGFDFDLERGRSAQTFP